MSDDELPLTTALNAGTFECLGDTLVWRPAAFPASDLTIELLDASGAPIGAELSLLPSVGTLVRFQIIGIQDPPHFARARLRDDAVFSIITVIDRLRTSIRELSSKRSETVAIELQDETEARVLLYEAIDILEAAEQAETAGAAPLSDSEGDNSKPEVVPDHRILSYEEFIQGTQATLAVPLSHRSPPGRVQTGWRHFDRIIYGTGEIVAGADASVPDDLFDLADETADAQEAIRAGKNFGDKKRRRPGRFEQAEKKKIAKQKRLQGRTGHS